MCVNFTTNFYHLDEQGCVKCNTDDGLIMKSEVELKRPTLLVVYVMSTLPQIFCRCSKRGCVKCNTDDVLIKKSEIELKMPTP